MDISKYADANIVQFPLPIYTSVPIARAVAKDKEVFEIVAGLDPRLVKALQEHSLDANDEALKVTSDRERFGEGSYEDWYKKGRVPFALVHSESGQLAALSWFGPKPLGRKPLKHLSEQERGQDERKLESGGWHTISYRSYPPFRGRGLMKSFVAFAMAEYASYYPGAKFWEGVDNANPASAALATSLGFRPEPSISDSDGKWVVMVKDSV